MCVSVALEPMVHIPVVKFKIYLTVVLLQLVDDACWPIPEGSFSQEPNNTYVTGEPKKEFSNKLLKI